MGRFGEVHPVWMAPACRHVGVFSSRWVCFRAKVGANLSALSEFMRVQRQRLGQFLLA